MEKEVTDFNGKKLYCLRTMYNRRVWYSMDATPELNNLFDVDPIAEDSDAETQTVRNKETYKRGELIRFVNEAAVTPENIAHEALHAALDIFEEVTNSRVSISNADLIGTESLCYLVSSIVREIWQTKVAREYNGTEPVNK